MEKKLKKAVLGSSGIGESERAELDFYSTDPSAIDRLLKVYPLPSNIWECACGNGNLSKRLETLGYNVVSTDITDRGYGSVQDFLTTTEMPAGCQAIVTNPPYIHATSFVLHALDLIPKDGIVAMFLKLQFLESKGRYESIFRTMAVSVHPRNAVLQE